MLCWYALTLAVGCFHPLCQAPGLHRPCPTQPLTCLLANWAQLAQRRHVPRPVPQQALPALQHHQRCAGARHFVPASVGRARAAASGDAAVERRNAAHAGSAALHPTTCPTNNSAYSSISQPSTRPCVAAGDAGRQSRRADRRAPHLPLRRPPHRQGHLPAGQHRGGCGPGRGDLEQRTTGGCRRALGAVGRGPTTCRARHGVARLPQLAEAGVLPWSLPDGCAGNVVQSSVDGSTLPAPCSLPTHLQHVSRDAPACQC